MYRRVMVPLDGTADCEHAIPLALSIAEREGAVVELVHVAVPPALAAQMATPGIETYSGAGAVAQVAEEAHEAAVRNLSAVAADACRATSAQLESTVLDRSDVARAIAEHAAESHPDLLVMTKHDHSRLERLILGSVSESVVRRVHVPVLVTPSGPDRPSFSHRVSVDHVLVPLDGSELGATVLPYARALARAMDARVTLLTVTEPVLIPPSSGQAEQEATLAPTPAGAAAFLARTANELRGAGITTEPRTIAAPDRAGAILDFAESNAADVIAMSTHGRRGVGRLLAGSVAAKVLHRARVTVMMYRPEQPR